VENRANDPQEPAKPGSSKRKPPGQFISDELEAETARFIEQAKGLARRRNHVAKGRNGGPPPPRGGDDQRSRRR
jgi:hypothetical protein